MEESAHQCLAQVLCPSVRHIVREICLAKELQTAKKKKKGFVHFICRETSVEKSSEEQKRLKGSCPLTLFRDLLPALQTFRSSSDQEGRGLSGDKEGPPEESEERHLLHGRAFLWKHAERKISQGNHRCVMP